MARGAKLPKPTDPEQLQMLKRIKWLSDSGRTKLAADADLVRYRARQPIYLEHQAADRVFFLLAGIAKVYYLHRKQRILVAHLASGDTFGMAGLFPDGMRRYSSEAVSDCMVLSVRPQTFSEAVFGSALERIGPALANTVGRWFDLVWRYTRFIPLGTRGRLALSLIEMANKFGVRDSRGVLLPVPISHAELGTMVGSSRQHVTMQLKEFERDGYIIRDGRRLIVIPERLQSALES